MRSLPPTLAFGDRVAALTEWQRQLQEAGFLGLSWPEAYGGRGLGPGGGAVLCEVLARCSMPELSNRVALYTDRRLRAAGERW